MSDLTDMLIDDAAAVATEAGESVSYTPYGQTARSITGIVEYDKAMKEYYPDSVQDVRLGVLYVKPADIPTPTVQDKVSIAGTVWAVRWIGNRYPLTQLQIETRAVGQWAKGHERERRV